LGYITVQRREIKLISPEADDLDRASTTMVSLVPTNKKRTAARSLHKWQIRINMAEALICESLIQALELTWLLERGS